MGIGGMLRPESNDFVDYNLIGDSSHNFTELPAAVWAAFVVSHF